MHCYIKILQKSASCGSFFKYMVVFILLSTYGSNSLIAQSNDTVQIISSLDLDQIPKQKIKKYWFKVGTDAFGRHVVVPVLVLRGQTDSPVLGMTAAIHGNELNGIPVIQRIFSMIDPATFRGTLIGIPGINPESMQMYERRFTDGEDLNRVFPGKRDGSESEQRAYHVLHDLIAHMDISIDMHTASFGRENSFYVRADMNDDTLGQLARIQMADILVDNAGKPSFGGGSGLTARAAAIEQGVKTITIEYGNPQVYQSDMIERGTIGVLNALKWLKMVPGDIQKGESGILCKSSSWMYTDTGGFLEVSVQVAQKITKGEKIAVLKNAFGDIIKYYYSPSDGVVIGRSSNPIAVQGARIIHLGKY
jgi:uncharacterized protein